MAPASEWIGGETFFAGIIDPQRKTACIAGLGQILGAAFVVARCTDGLVDLGGVLAVSRAPIRPRSADRRWNVPAPVVEQPVIGHEAALAAAAVAFGVRTWRSLAKRPSRRLILSRVPEEPATSSGLR